MRFKALDLGSYENRTHKKVIKPNENIGFEARTLNNQHVTLRRGPLEQQFEPPRGSHRFVKKGKPNTNNEKQKPEQKSKQ